MARLIIPTEASVRGPWLIETTQLLALDDLANEYLPKLEGERSLLIENEAEEYISNRSKYKGMAPAEADEARKREIDSLSSFYKAKDRRSINVYLRGGRTIQAETFKEAMNQTNAASECPVGFRWDLRLSPIRAEVSLSSGWRENLEITVEPESSSAGQEFYGALRNWAESMEAPRWQQKWLSWRAGIRYFLFVWIVGGLFAAVTLGSANEHYKEEARQLVSHGVTNENEHRALEMVLGIVSDYDPPERQTSPGSRYWGYFFLGMTALGCLSACPSVVIGMYKGKRRVKVWRVWLRFVTVTIPGLIVSSIIWPWILGLIRRNLSG